MRGAMRWRPAGAAAALIWLLAGWLLSSCQTPMPITDDMNPPEFFQAARHAVAQRDYRSAMEYYRVYLERFPAAGYPGELERNLWAEYEIGFMHHKLGDDRTAAELLGRLIARYDGEGGEDLPPAPGRLARRVVEELEAPEP